MANVPVEVVSDWGLKIVGGIGFIVSAIGCWMFHHLQEEDKRIEKKQDKDIREVHAKMETCIKTVLDAIEKDKTSRPSIDTCNGVQALFDNKLTGVAASLEQLAQTLENLRVDVNEMKNQIMVKR